MQKSISEILKIIQEAQKTNFKQQLHFLDYFF